MPPCSRCPRSAVVHMRYAGTHLCREHFLASFAKRAKAELSGQGRLPQGTVAVALSGGKDSVAALHFLHGLVQSQPGIRLVAVTVDEGIAGYRDQALRICHDVTTALDVPWRVVGVKELAGYTIDEYAAGVRGPRGQVATGAPRPACGPCGVFRRVGMNRLAQEAGAAAVVTGHNLDDMAQTILMNHLKGDIDRLARLAPHDTAEAREGLVPRLMPFRTIPEKEVLLYGVLHDLPVHQASGGAAAGGGGPGSEGGGVGEGAAGGEVGAECPYAARSHRFALRDVLVGLEAATPGTRHALVRGQERLKPILQAALPVKPMVRCPQCGEAASGAVCAACAMRA